MIGWVDMADDDDCSKDEVVKPCFLLGVMTESVVGQERESEAPY